MRHLSHLISMVAVGVLALAGPTSAQAPPSTITPGCHSHADLSEMLHQKFAELPSVMGLQADGHLIEVYVAADGRSWTIVVTRPDGWSCIVAVGEHWELLPDRITEPIA